MLRSERLIALCDSETVSVYYTNATNEEIEEAIEERDNWLERDDELTEFDSDEDCIKNYLYNECEHKYIEQAFSIECRRVTDISGIKTFDW